MKTFHWTIFLLLPSLFFACDLFQPDPKEEDEDQIGYEAQLSRIFGGSLFDYFPNHNLVTRYGEETPDGKAMTCTRVSTK